MADLEIVKMADKQGQNEAAPQNQTSSTSTVKRSNSTGNDVEHKRPPLKQRNSWPTNQESLSPRGPMKSHVARMKEELTVQEVEENNKDDQANDLDNVNDLEDDDEAFPDASKQLKIIKNIDNECTCTYAISKIWYKQWEEFVGVAKVTEGTEAETPGSVEMDTHNDANNEYVNEEAWKRLVRWYGVSLNHQLDRKHMYFKDEKMFDICVLSPFSGIVEHNVKKFNRFEEIGYIECQLRRVFRVPEYKKTRLWISEKAQVPRFRQLLLRFRMLNDCIHRDKVYILALEQCGSADSWPTGEPGDPKGDLTKYRDLITGPKGEEFWNQEIADSLDTLQDSVAEMIRQSVDDFMRNSLSLMGEQEEALDTMRKSIKAKLENVTLKETAMDEKAKSLSRDEETLKENSRNLDNEKQDLLERQRRFQEEMARMESLHQIQETKIKLDVGGQVYTTSIQTLRRDPESLLAAMFSGRYEMKREADGSYFVDRDGTHFRHILNFLRDGHLEAGTLPSEGHVIKELIREAKYYKLNNLVTYMQELHPGNVSP